MQLYLCRNGLWSLSGQNLLKSRFEIPVLALIIIRSFLFYSYRSKMGKEVTRMLALADITFPKELKTTMNLSIIRMVRVEAIYWNHTQTNYYKRVTPPPLSSSPCIDCMCMLLYERDQREIIRLDYLCL